MKKRYTALLVIGALALGSVSTLAYVNNRTDVNLNSEDNLKVIDKHIKDQDKQIKDLLDQIEDSPTKDEIKGIVKDYEDNLKNKDKVIHELNKELDEALKEALSINKITNDIIKKNNIKAGE